MLPPPGRQRWRVLRVCCRADAGSRRLLYRRHLYSVTSPPRDFVVFPFLINGRVVSVALWRRWWKNLPPPGFHGELQIRLCQQETCTAH